MSYSVEVDQSGKEDTAILVFANGESYSVLIPAVVKRAIFRELTDRGLSEEEITIKFFSVDLYFILREHIAAVPKSACLALDALQ